MHALQVLWTFFLTFNAETESQEVAQALREVVIPLVQLPEQLGLKDYNTYPVRERKDFHDFYMIEQDFILM